MVSRQCASEVPENEEYMECTTIGNTVANVGNSMDYKCQLELLSIGEFTDLSAAICLMPHASAVLEAARSTQHAAVANAANLNEDLKTGINCR